MKKFFLGMLAIVAIVATSCLQDTDLGVNAGETATVTFNVGAPTRAYSDGETATVLQYAVYDADGKELTDLTKSLVNGNAETINISKTVNLQLVTGNTYAVIFWAAAPNAPYSVDFNSQTMTVDYNGALSNDENRDAFYKYHTFTVKGAQTETIELRRPFAQLNIGTNDYAAAASAGYTPETSWVTVKNIYTTLDLNEGKVSNPVEVTFAEKEIPTTETFPVSGHEYLAMNYLLVNERVNIEVEFSYKDADAAVQGEETKTRTVGSVPVERNHRTNLYGSILTSDVAINVIIKPEYETPDYNQTPSVKVGGKAYDNIVDAIAAAEDGVTTEIELLENLVLPETVVIPEGKIVTINFNGFTITSGDVPTTTYSTRANAGDTYAFNNHGTLILDGGEISARGIYNGYDVNGNHTTNARLIVNNATINAVGETGGAGIFNYGVTEINGGTFTGKCGVNNQTGGVMTINKIAVEATSAYGIQNNGGTLVVNNGTSKSGVYCNGGTVTIKNGEFINSTSGRHVVYAYNTKVVIEGGKFHNNNSGNATLMLAGSSKGTINGGEFSIKDGRVPGNGNTYTSCLLDTSNSATLTINNGLFNGGFRVQTGTTCTINGGSFNDCYGSNYNIYGTVVVKGGTYTDTTAQTFGKKYQDTACNITTNEDGSITISQEPYYVENGNYYITSVAGWEWMESQSDAFFAGKTIYLTNDLNFAGVNVKPTRFWEPENRTVFNGQNYTISNVTISGGDQSALFNGTADIKNLKVENANVSGRGYTAVIGGNLYGSVENCHVINSEVTGSYWQVGGLVGQWNSGNILNCSIENTTVNGPSAVGMIVGIFNENSSARKIENCQIKDCAVVQTYSFGANYDTLFAVVAGYLNTHGEYHFNNVSIENSTLRGEASELIYGDYNGTVYVNGVQQ